MSSYNLDEIKVGDTLKIVGTNHPFFSVTIGKEYEVTDVDPVTIYNNTENHQILQEEKYSDIIHNSKSGFQPFQVHEPDTRASELYQQIAIREGVLMHGEHEKTFSDVNLVGVDDYYDYLTFKRPEAFVGHEGEFDNMPVLESPSIDDFVDALNGNYDFDPIPEVQDIAGHETNYNAENDVLEVGCHETRGDTVLEVAETIREIRERESKGNV